MKKNINEELSKKDIRIIKSLIKSEIDDIHDTSKFKKSIKKIVEDEFEYIKDLDPETQEKHIENIFKELLQSYHDLFYRERNIIKNKINR
jgi:hypothetical protein